MFSTGPASPVARHAPRWPTLLLAVFALLAAVSLLQGVVDVVLPVLRGEPSFGFVYAMTAEHGPAFFIAYVFVHNLGLACIVPGFGFLAAYFERKTANRALIGLLLAGAVVASLLVAAEFILSAPALFDLPVTIALLVGEAVAVLALAIPAALQLRGFVPTRAYAWSLVTPFRRLRAPFAASATILLVLAGYEAYVVLG